MEQSSSFYAAVGGHPTFERLADGFYVAVAADPVLRAMYPDDLADARWRMMAFLEQYWGGPTSYSEQRGHPRLRMRHQPFTIDPEARDRWLACMRSAVDGLDLAPAQRSELWDYLERAAHSMVNAAAPEAGATPAHTPAVSAAASALAEGPALAPAAAQTPSAADPVATLLSILTLEQTGETTFVGNNLPQPGGRVFGGQVLAQALLAAGLTVPAARQPHSMHGYFLRAGDINEPITFSVEALRDGRSFTARRTHAIQNGEPILSMIASFQEEQPGTEFHDTAPDAPHPDVISSALDQLGRIDDPVARFWSHDSAFDVRHVNGAIYLRPQERSSDQLVWMRTKSALPDDQLIHRAVVAAACDQLMLEPVLRRSGLSWLVPGLSIASLDHAMWWHRDVRADEWLLFVQSSPSAGGGRGLGQAKVFNTDGTLVATIAQEGMIRVPQD